jgi:RNA polymerase sigma-70 factor (ECF subfamily)
MIAAQDKWVAEMDDELTAIPGPAAHGVRARSGLRRDAPEPVNSHPEPSAEQLAARCQAGCADSFEQLVLRFQARVFNFLRQFTRNPHDAEDLTQVTFVKAFRSLPRYQPSLAFAPWLFSIARRTAANHFRSAGRFEELPADEQVDDVDPARLLASKEEQSAIWRVARTLKPALWEVLWLRYGEDFSVAEIARITGTTRIHVKVRLHRARSALATKLAKVSTPIRI